MGVQYVYANHSKKQYFDIGLFGESCRFRHAGFSFGSRALSLLISERGDWNGDSIEMVDDVSDTSVVVSSQYTNIRVEAELLILDVDGVEYFNEANDLDIITFTSSENICWPITLSQTCSTTKAVYQKAALCRKSPMVTRI